MANIGSPIRFLTAGLNSAKGLAGFLTKIVRAFGTATVVSGQTAIVVTDTDAKAGDVIIASPLTKGTNAAYVVGTSISAGVSFTLTVNTDPGSGGVVLAYLRLRNPAS